MGKRKSRGELRVNGKLIGRPDNGFGLIFKPQSAAVPRFPGWRLLFGRSSAAGCIDVYASLFYRFPYRYTTRFYMRVRGCVSARRPHFSTGTCSLNKRTAHALSRFHLDRSNEKTKERNDTAANRWKTGESPDVRYTRNSANNRSPGIWRACSYPLPFFFSLFFFFFSFPYRYLHTRAQDSYEPIFPLFRDALFPPLPWLTVFLLKGLENYYSRGRMLDSGNNFPRRSFHFQNYFVEVDEAVTLSWYNFNLKKVLSRGRMNYNSATKWVIISTSWWNLV